MAVSGAVKLEVIARAEENIKAVLRDSNKAIKETGDALREAQGSQEGLTNSFQDAIDKLTDLNLSMRAMGVVAAIEVAGQVAQLGMALFEATKSGAMLADQFAAVHGRVANLPEVISEVQLATTGMIDEASIVNAVAQFDAFGLSIELLPEMMEQAVKASLRTGEDIDHLISSAVTGIARMSPPILDNLGLQVKLSDATKKAADMFGVQAKSLDDTAKKAGMLRLVLDQLGEQNADIDLNRSRVASMKRVETGFVDLKNSVTKSIAELLSGGADATAEFAAKSKTTLRKTGEAWKALTNNIKTSIDAIGGALKDIKNIDLSAMRRAALDQEESAARRALSEKQLVDAQRARAVLNTSLMKLTFKHAETGQELISDQKEYNRLLKSSTFHLEQRQRQERAALEAQIMRRREEEERRTKEDRKAIRESLEMTRLARGESQKKIDLEKAEAALKEAVAKGDREQVDILGEKIVRLEKGLKTREKTFTVSKQNTQEIRDQLEMIEQGNVLALAGSAEQIKRFEREKKIADIKADASFIEDKDLRTAFEKARILEMDIELRQKADALSKEKNKEAADALRVAQEAFNLSQATTESAIIDLELEHRIAEIKRESLSLDEQSLLIDLAKLEAEQQREELARLNREQLAETLGEGFGGAFAEGASLLEEMDETLDELNRPKRFETLIKGFNTVSKTIPDAADKFAELGDSSLDSGEKIAGGIAAGLGAIGPSVAAFVDGTVEKAAIMGAFEAAMAIATAFTNPAEAASHGVAAAMFFAMAGTAASQPKTAIPDAETAGAGGLITPAAEAPEERAAGSFTINLGPGTIFGLPQEMGAQIAERINSMSGSGFEESTAF